MEIIYLYILFFVFAGFFRLEPFKNFSVRIERFFPALNKAGCKQTAKKKERKKRNVRNEVKRKCNNVGSKQS